MRNVAVILAGGRGKRFGQTVPKQFIQVAGKSILEWTVSVFAQHPLVDEICVVTENEWMAYVQSLFDTKTNAFYHKVKNVICGGKERYHSSLSAIEVYKTSPCRLLIHDAVRPLLSQSIITKCIDNDYQACAVGIPCTNTIWQTAENDNTIHAIEDRTVLWEAQTPQCFNIDVLQKAYSAALCDTSFQPTDDCGVVRKYCPAIPIHIFKGETTNIKVTYPTDLAFVRMMLEKSFSELPQSQNDNTNILTSDVIRSSYPDR